MNEQGSVEVCALLLLVALTAALGFQVHAWNHRLQQVQKHHRQVLCLKEAKLETERLVFRIGGLNKILATGRVGQFIGLFIPGGGWIAAMEWEKAKRAIMRAQDGLWLLSQRKFLSLKRRCELPLSVNLTFYKFSAGLERQGDVAILRSLSGQWWLQTPLVQYLAQWSLTDPTDTRISWRIQ